MNAAWLPRLAWAAAGLVWFFWIGIEDRGPTGVLALAALVGLAGLTSVWQRWLMARPADRRLVGAGLAGLISGALVPLIAVGLMFIKVSLHDHPVPDFREEQIYEVLARVPAWALIGLLGGAALGLIGPASKPPHVASPPTVAYNDHEEGGEVKGGHGPK